MTLASLPIILWLNSAHATAPSIRVAHPVAVPSCAKMLMPATDASPNPFDVNPADVSAILAFVERITPFPSDSEPWAMHLGLKRFWRVYRPDLTERDLDERLDAFRRSVYALQVIRRTHRMSLSEKGRLRLTWLKFLADVAHPDNPAMNPLYAEHALSLMHRRNPTFIVGRLRAIVPCPVEYTVASVAHAVAHLWVRDFSAPAPDFADELEMPWRHAVTYIWHRYVDALGAVGGKPRAPARSLKRQSKYTSDTAVDVTEVGKDPRAIASFLITHFPDIPIADRPLDKIFARLREQHGLAPRDEGFLKKDLHTILYERRSRELPSGRLVNAWTTFLTDLERARSVPQAAE